MFDLNHLHPMIVHFPIALIIVGFFSDLVGAVTKRTFFTSAGLYLIVLGTLGAIAAYITGNLAGDGVTEAGALGRALETHEDAATLALWTTIVVAAVRILLGITRRMTGWMQWAMVALLAVSVATISRTGYYGGELVFKHAAGVELTFGIPQADTPLNLDQDTTTAAKDDD